MATESFNLLMQKLKDVEPQLHALFEECNETKRREVTTIDLKRSRNLASVARYKVPMIKGPIKVE
jgi:hypothetical protein